jgi:hypothetical protein
MDEKLHRSTYVRVAVASHTDLNLELQNAPNRAARLLELATMGLALHKAAMTAQLVRTSRSSAATIPPDASPLAPRGSNRHMAAPLDDDLMRMWSHL